MSFWQKTKRFYEPARSHIWLIFVMGGLSAAISTATGYYLVYITKRFSDYFANFEPDSFWIQVGFTMGIYLIFVTSAYLLRNFVWVYPEPALKKFLNKKYYTRFVTSDNLAAEKLGTGRLISILSTGLEKWALMVNEVTNNLYRWIILISFSTVTLAQTSGSLMVGFGILFVIIAINMVTFSRIGLFWRTKRKEVLVEIGRIETKVLMSKFEVLQNNNIGKEVEKLDAYLDQYREYSKKSQTTNVGSWQISRVMISLFMIFICFGFFDQARKTGVTSELLANFGVNMGLMTTFATYFSLLIEYYIGFTKDFIHVEKLWDTFDHLPQIKGYDTGKMFQYKKGNFSLDTISFSYNKGQNVLKDFSLTIKGGKKTALVGLSGSGKTTLMKLIAGYMRPTKGSILIDGQDITKIRLDSYYPHIGYLTQEPSVFDGTIEENLLYGLSTEEAARDGLIERMAMAIQLAECQFIADLEDGIQTEIGERGIRLSGGQKQRLAIAKIFLKNPEIILLDEPTAALDSYSEQKVARAFVHLFSGRTVIVIAHRLQTVKSADDIIVLDKGKIIERGTHEKLLKLGKKYAGMVDLQSGFMRDEDEETLLDRGILADSELMEDLTI